MIARYFYKFIRREKASELIKNMQTDWLRAK